MQLAAANSVFLFFKYIFPVPFKALLVWQKTDWSIYFPSTVRFQYIPGCQIIMPGNPGRKENSQLFSDGQKPCIKQAMESCAEAQSVCRIGAKFFALAPWNNMAGVQALGN